MKLDLFTKRTRLTGQYSDAGGVVSGNFLIKGFQTRDRIHTLLDYLTSSCINYALNLSLSAPTIQFIKCALGKRTLL